MNTTTPGQRIARCLFVGCAVLLAAPPAPAAPGIPPGTLGWTVQDYNRAAIVYVADPVAACREMRIIGLPGTFSGALVGIQSPTFTWWQGDSYICNYADVAGNKMSWTTALRCEAGYSPRWPGLCLPNGLQAPPVPPSCSPQDPGFMVGGQVLVASGYKVQRETDFAAAPGGMLEVVRTYRSVLSRFQHPLLTHGWAFSFEREFSVRSLPQQAPAEVSILSGDGSMVLFRRVGNGYNPVGAVDATLRASPAYDEWFYRSQSGTLERYVKAGDRFRVASIHNASGVGLAYSYGDDGRLARITDSFGRALSMNWGERWIESIEAPQGKVSYVTEQFEPMPSSPMWEKSRLQKATLSDLAGNVLGSREYHYGDDWFGRTMLTGITDELGVRYASFAYDGAGRVAWSEYAGGVGRHEFEYAADSTAVTDPLGARRMYAVVDPADVRRVASVSQPGGAGCMPAATRLDYASYGLLVSSLDFNRNKTCYKYDSLRSSETGRLEGLAETDACPYGLKPKNASQRLTQVRWHPAWHLQSQVSGPLRITSFIYNGEKDLDGKVLSCAGGATLPDGRPIAVLCKKVEQPTLDANGAAGFSAAPAGAARVTSYTYNSDGQVLTQAMAGSVTRYEYYGAAGAAHMAGDLRTVTNPAGHVREYLAYTPAGQPLLVREPNGQLTRIDYDGLGRTVQVTENAGTAGELRTRAAYDAAGQLISLGFADGSSLGYTYDGAHRLAAITDGDGNAIPYTRDAAGNVLREEVVDAAGTLARRTERTFDILGRVEAAVGEQP